MKEYLICVDSDGCAMDTMTMKHVRCFGPELVKVFGLEKWETAILKRWNEINLYTKKRGINRFQGLLLILSEVDAQYVKIDGLNKYADWANHTTAYSEASLQAAVWEAKEHVRLREKSGSVDGSKQLQETPEDAKGCALLEKALIWSQKVNAAIQAIPASDKREFPGVREAFEKMKAVADLAIVSSANREAMEEEWERCGLMPYVDYAMAQDVGTKAVCIKKMIEKGYETSKIVMIGDAMGDFKAASEAGVSFYPILAGKEEASWEHFSKQVLDEIVNGRYTAERQKEEFEEFERGLEG